LTKPTGNFLIRRQLRAESRRLTQYLVLGFAISFFLIFIGSYKHLGYEYIYWNNEYIYDNQVFQDGQEYNNPWRWLVRLGSLCLIVTLFAPLIWARIEVFLRRFGHCVGEIILKFILILVYFILILPLGLILRATSGTHPIYYWENQRPQRMEGWIDKKLPYELTIPIGRNFRPSGLVSVLFFFVRRRKIAFLPVVLLLVSFGIVFFFVHTSALAPLIYTLF